MLLTDQEIGMGIMVVSCKCCGNVYKAHSTANACTYSLIPNFGCPKCLGVPSGTSQQDALGEGL